MDLDWGPSSHCVSNLFQENYDDPHKTPASPVVHIRGLIDGVVEADLVEALQEFGPIRYVFRCQGFGPLGSLTCRSCLVLSSDVAFCSWV